jgi:hypothetical protein
VEVVSKGPKRYVKHMLRPQNIFDVSRNRQEIWTMLYIFVVFALKTYKRTCIKLEYSIKVASFQISKFPFDISYGVRNYLYYTRPNLRLFVEFEQFATNLNVFSGNWRLL